MILHKLEIKNFQSHLNTILEFAPGLNAIIGASDSGKSAIIRALRWAVWNKPLGEEFVSWLGNGETQARLIFEGADIVRSQLKGVNAYYLNDEELKAFGASVPEEIAQALNIDKINLQQQHARPFLLDDTSGEVARHFNRIAHLDSIDTSLKNLQKGHRSVKQAIQSGKEHLLALQTQLVEYKNLEILETEVVAAEKYDRQFTEVLQRIGRLSRLLEENSRIQTQFENLNSVLRFESEAQELQRNYEEYTKTQDRVARLDRLVRQIMIIDQELLEIKAVPLQDKKAKALLQHLDELRGKEERCVQLGRLLKTITKVSQDVVRADNKRRELEVRYAELMPETCPLCGAEV
jgi:exonuclease SbcC